MPYSDEVLAMLARESADVFDRLQTLQLGIVKQGRAVADPVVEEYMLHGAGRRVSLLRRTIQNIFRAFPPSTAQPLGTDALEEAQINLQAFVINVYGVFENLAWAFLHRHNLVAAVGSRHNISLFKARTQQLLPPELRQYLTSETISRWHNQYLKAYRDALAHRIPLYIPPATFTRDEADRYNQLLEEEVTCIRAQRWERLEQVRAEMTRTGRPYFAFLNSFSATAKLAPVALHPQLICDAKAVIEFGQLYLTHWHRRA